MICGLNKVRHVRIDVLAMAEGSTDFARNLAGENGRAVVRAPEDEEQPVTPTSNATPNIVPTRSASSRESRLVGRLGLGHGGPVSTGMAGSWPHSNQPGS
jgi:hypothetical protein